MLVVTPSPMPTESLYGYVVRVSERNGYETPAIVLSYAGNNGAQGFGLTVDTKSLAKVTNCSPRLLQRLEYVHREAGRPKYFQLLGHQFSDGLNNQVLRPMQRTLCVECIREEGFIEAFWDLNIAVQCPIHGCKPLRRCPECDRQLDWRRPGLLRCRCGAPLNAGTRSGGSKSVSTLLGFVRAKLCGTKLNEVDCGSLPLEALRKMPLREMIRLIETLGFIGRGIVRRERRKRAGEIVQAASEALTDWPNGFHQYLYQLGERYQLASSSSVDLRKQFEPLYNSLFRHRSLRHSTGFLHEEFLRFIAKSERRALTRKSAADSQCGTEGIRGQCGGSSMPARQAAALIGLPVSVLQELKIAGHCRTHSQPTRGYHERDLVLLNQLFDRRGRSVQIKRLNRSRHISLDTVLSDTKFWSHQGKAGFVQDYLDGLVDPDGRTSDDPRSIFFKRSAVQKYVAEVRRAAAGGLAICTVARELFCTPACVEQLLEMKMLSTRIGRGCTSVCERSVLEFHTNYISINEVSKPVNSSTKRLRRLADQADLALLLVDDRTGYHTGFVRKADRERLVELLEVERKKKARKSRRISASQRDVKLLSKYLCKLKKANKPLPRKGRVASWAVIARQAGIERNAYYVNSKIRAVLMAYDDEDAERFAVRRVDDLSKLREYLTSVDLLKIPVRRNGNPNKLRIAASAGIDRNLFYSEPKAIKLLAELFTLRNHASQMRTDPSGNRS